jgi:hypothetical protein
MHAQSLPANPLEVGRILDRLRSVVHVAQTARRESHSGFVASLKEAQRGDPHQWKHCEPPDRGHIEAKEDAAEQQCRAEGDHARAQAVPLTAGTDVRDSDDATDS